MSTKYDIREIGARELPLKLSEIDDPPARLFVRGAEFDDTTPTLAVVGSRKMSAYGKRVCETLIEGLRGYNVQIVSGLAYGIDSTAHRAALSANLPTIAIPGSGVNDRALYPRRHIDLAHDILSSGGTVMSEFEPDQKANTWTFPQRNRIMAGLSDAVLLVEAAERSGTLITARLALEYNRDVYVVPGDIFSPTSRGTNALLRDGATPILETDDLIELMQLEPLSSDKTLDSQEDTSELLTLFEYEIDRDELLRSSQNPKLAQVELSKLEIHGIVEVSNGTVYKRGINKNKKANSST